MHAQILMIFFYSTLQPLGSRVALAEQRASRYIERNIGLIKDYGSSYEIAIVSYALAQAKAPQAEHAFKILANKMRSIGKLDLNCF